MSGARPQADANRELPAGTLSLAVPLHMAGAARMTLRERGRIARKAAAAAGHQGDSLMFGTGVKPGTAAREAERHRLHASRVNGGSRMECGRTCRICLRGQPSHTAGELFTLLARGLAAAAFQPGGVSFAGLHWCAAPHDGCPHRARGEAG